MNSRKLMKLAAALLAVVAFQANAETLTQYVAACRSQLSIPTNVNIANLDCYDGDLFATGGDVNDRMGYKAVTDQVDLVFACRWVFGDKTARQTAVSVELLLHNRQNGNTCYFSALNSFPGDQQVGPPSFIISPTATNASSYWAQPQEVNDKVRCIGCHVSGAYISTPRIAPYLAKFGLLNNGHDTLSAVTPDDLSTNPDRHVRYHAVITPPASTSAFAQWNSLKQGYVQNDCSQSCHMLGTGSPQEDIKVLRKGPETVLPGALSIYQMTAPVMSPSNEDSDYRWINLDTAGNGVEAESFADAKSASATLVPVLLGNCAAPGNLEAHAVGIDVSNSFSTSGLAQTPDRLRSFNLKDGLVCLNADQTSGSCRDYDVRYLCSNGSWTPFYNKDTNASDDGDHEERSKAIAQASAFCGSAPVGIHARVYMPAPGGGTIPVGFYGPNDRLARFSPYGLTCNNADQPDGQCSNYVVRYSNCGTAPPTRPAAHLTSVFTGRQLTATGTANNALTKGQPLTSGWNTQTWDIVPVPNTEYVRLRNTGTNTWLNVTTQAESATVVTYAFNDGFSSEEWIIEPVPNSNDARLKNLWSGRYLTIGDVPNRDFAPIYSQALVPGWTSQRWVIN